MGSLEMTNSELNRREAIAEGAALQRVSRLHVLILGLLIAASPLITPGNASAFSNRLNAISISFPSSHLGYVLSLYDCTGNTCATLQSTSDNGVTWRAVPVPSQLNQDLHLVSWATYGNTYATLTVHFADARDGWIYGTVPAPVTPDTSNPNLQSRLWSTHDGGRTWQQIRLGPLSISAGVIQMATHGADTYAFGESEGTGSARILATRSTTNQWKDDSTTPMEGPAGGTPLEGSFTFSGLNGWFVAGNDRGFTSSAELSSKGTWKAWSTPSSALFGGSFSPVSSVTNQILIAHGASTLIVYPPSSSVPAGWNNGASWLFISYNAGAKFQPLRQLTRSYQLGYENVPGLPATPTPGTILLEQYTNSAHRLVRSTDWGRSWHVVINHAILQVQFASRSDGFAIAVMNMSQTSLNTSLLHSSDAGSHWSAINL
jgi:hypothetical protein